MYIGSMQYYCVNKIDSKNIEGLDLSSWRLAFNGAEAVNPQTMQRFIKKFEPFGFKPEAMHAVYGLAESSVALAFPKLHQPAKTDYVERDSFESKQKAIPTALGSKNTLAFAICGEPLEGHDIRIVDKDQQALGEREVGCVQFKGPSSS